MDCLPILETNYARLYKVICIRTFIFQNENSSM